MLSPLYTQIECGQIFPQYFDVQFIQLNSIPSAIASLKMASFPSLVVIMSIFCSPILLHINLFTFILSMVSLLIVSEKIAYQYRRLFWHHQHESRKAKHGLSNQRSLPLLQLRFFHAQLCAF